MSDYIPNPPNPERDPRNYDRYYEDNSGKGVTLVVGILVAIALAAGLMFFAGSPNERTDQAQAAGAGTHHESAGYARHTCDAAGGSGPSGCQSAAVRPPKRSCTKNRPGRKNCGRAIRPFVSLPAS